MISNMISVYRKHGFFHSLRVILNFILTRTVGFRIEKSIGINTSIVARKIFNNRRLKKSNDGYYFVHPMPTEDELGEYYSSVYWDSRHGKKYGVSGRDLIHYHLLKNKIADFFKKNRL